jgi:hypothetical protein
MHSGTPNTGTCVIASSLVQTLGFIGNNSGGREVTLDMSFDVAGDTTQSRAKKFNDMSGC